MNIQEVRKLLFAINSAYPNYKPQNPEETASVWADLLGDQDANSIFAAFKVYARSDQSGFAPSPGQLIHGAMNLRHKDDGILTSSEAWALVYRAIRRSGDNSKEEFEALPPEVQKAVGSPGQLRAWALDDQFNEGVASSNFRRAYDTVLERKRNDALIPADVRRALAQQTHDIDGRETTKETS